MPSRFSLLNLAGVTTWIVACAVLATHMLALAAAAVAAQETPHPPALSDCDKVKAANHLLKVQVAQLSAQLADATAKLDNAVLTTERAALIETFRTTLGADPDATFDWSTLTFTPEPRR